MPANIHMAELLSLMDMSRAHGQTEPSEVHTCSQLTHLSLCVL